MDKFPKEWLVRTRGGEFLGPFTQRELFEQVKNGAFNYDDEIGPSQGRWLSAQTLAHRDAEDFTRTSTRNHTITRSTSTSNPIKFDGNHSDYGDELTPTPDAITLPNIPGSRPQRAPSPPAAKNSGRAPSVAPTLTAIAVLGILWAVIVLVKPRNQTNGSSSSQSAKGQSGGESEFVRQIYGLIQAGETQAALRQLTIYHERGAAKQDLDYLIPYSALLITEGESPVRARRFLEQILSSPKASAQLKSHAHHWLGYLLLSQDEADMGEGHFLEALQLNPKDPAARFNLGRSYLKQGKFSQALDYFQLAELEVPDLWLVHIYKGRARESLGNLQEARVSFQTAIENSPDRWMSYVYFSLFLLQTHEIDAAQVQMKKMLTRDPHYETHSPAPLGFYQEKVNYRDYLSSFSLVMDKASGEEKEMGKIYINYLMNGRDEDNRIQAVAEKGGILSKVVALKTVLDRDASEDEIRKSLARLPVALVNFGYYAFVLRGEARMRLADFTGAGQDFQHAMDLSPLSAVPRWAYASLLRKTGHVPDAQAQIKTLLGYHPNYIPAIVMSHNF